MKLKRLIAAFLMLFPCITACASLPTPDTKLPPYTKWPFDVSKRDSKVNQEFKIREHRSYYFAIRFDYVGFDDELRVCALVEGITIPIHVKITKLATGNAPQELIYENTVTTSGYCIHGGEYYLREIIFIDLKPGIYRVEANAIEDRPEFSGTPTYLQIEGRSTK